MALEEEELLVKQLPHSVEAEQAVLGSMLIDPRCVSQVIDQLRPDDFYGRQNRDIYETIYSMVITSATIDPVTVVDQMRKNGTFDENTTRGYLLQLMDITPTAANAEVIYFTTTIERYIDGGAVSIEPHCVPFSKETGEAMELQDVFLCTPETLIQTLLSHSNIATPELEPEMIDAFRLDYVTIGQERLGVTFPDGTLPSHEGTATFRFSYDDAVTWLMQPWAVPGAE